MRTRRASNPVGSRDRAGRLGELFERVKIALARTVIAIALFDSQSRRPIRSRVRYLGNRYGCPIGAMVGCHIRAGRSNAMFSTILTFTDFFWIWFIVAIASGGMTYLRK